MWNVFVHHHYKQETFSFDTEVTKTTYMAILFTGKHVLWRQIFAIPDTVAIFKEYCYKISLTKWHALSICHHTWLYNNNVISTIQVMMSCLRLYTRTISTRTMNWYYKSKNKNIETWNTYIYNIETVQSAT